MKPALDKRGALRTKMVLPLKTSTAGSATTPTTAVHTLDVSRLGAKLGAFREMIKLGDTLVVQRHHKRARCKVVWVREIGPREVHVGIEFVSAEDNFWGVPLEDDRVGVWTADSYR